jgi:non-specific serine/threonine protein kinase/serine/threonine-protein kinase
VESLLDQEEHFPPILKTAEPLKDYPSSEPPLPNGIGPFRILKLIGEGGMGVVFEAEQQEPIRRCVALKLIRSGFESERVVSRFDMERRVLAQLEHPGIARILDAGTTENNLPYFAMELVHGTPITEYCDRNRVGVRGRLELFLQVCEAVEHAHRNAIIHRDIKPSNILVAETDGNPVPKIIDFGVAKALGDVSDGHALLTVAGQLIGTPAYMSPEQASNSPDLDTRTDVYSLGAVLYELLVGRRPFDLRDQDTPDSDDLRRRIRQDDPLAPSERLAAMGLAFESVARSRGTAPVTLRRRVRGDLDWIVIRAIEKEPSRRYGSASELARDIRRHLDYQPVQATPPGVAYRVRKFVRRNRTGIAAAALLVTVVLGFATALAVQARELVKERDSYRELSEFLIDFFATRSLAVARHRAVPLRTVMADGVEKAKRELADRPELQAPLLLALGQALLSAGDLEHAESTLNKARDRLHELHGSDHPLTLDAASALAKVHLSRRGYEEAERLLEVALESRRRELGKHAPDTARTLAELAYLYKLTKDFDRSARLYETALEDLRLSLGEDDRETVLAACLLASVYLEQRRLDGAEVLLLESLPRLAEDDPEKGLAHYNLAAIAALRGERDRVLSLLRKAVFAYNVKIGFQGDPMFSSFIDDPEFIELGKRVRIANPEVANFYLGQAAKSANRGRFAEAESIYRGFVRDQPWGDGREAGYLGRLYVIQSRYEEAEPILWQNFDAKSVVYGPEHPTIAISLWYLAQCRLGQGDRRGAIVHLERAVGILERSSGIVAGTLEYSRALLDAVRGDRDGALRHLRLAVDQGFWDPAWYEREMMLEPLPGTPEFDSIIAAMERRFAYP